MNMQAKIAGDGCAQCSGRVTKKGGRFCSKRCSALFQNAARRASGADEERFWSNIDKRGDDECWQWTAGRATSGYGVMRFKGCKTGSHRIAYLLANGAIPEGKLICHRCGNRSCCNPAHIYAGSHADNTNDALSHGTFKRNFGVGSGHIGARLNEDKVRAIRAALRSGERQRSIASRFDVAQQTISRVATGKDWSHVAG